MPQYSSFVNFFRAAFNFVKPGVVTQIQSNGVAVIVATGPIGGGYISNPASDQAQGVTAEILYVDPTRPPGSTDATANGTTTGLLPSQTYEIPPLKIGQSVWANAATGGHKFTAVTWSN